MNWHHDKGVAAPLGGSIERAAIAGRDGVNDDDGSVSGGVGAVLRRGRMAAQRRSDGFDLRVRRMLLE